MSVFRDELVNMLPDHPLSRRLAKQTFLLSEFLEKEAPDFDPPKLDTKAIVHGHCHHKAIMRFHDEEAVMKQIGLDFQLLDSGCCGMAGSFGYEADKYDVSVKCGERALLPAVRRAALSTVIMADGFSCREQISQQTSRHAMHLAEVMQMAQHHTRSFDGMYPEADLVERRHAGLRRSRLRTLAALAGLACGAVILAKTIRKHR